MEIPSRCRAHIAGEKAVSPRGGPNQASLRKEGCQEKEGRCRSKACRLSSRLNCVRRWSARRAEANGSTKSNLTATAFRCGSRDGEVTLKTRKGLDWTPKFGAIATAASALPDCIIDGEIVALDHRGSPDFAGLQAALSDGKTDDLIFFAFDLLFLKGTGFAPAEPRRPQAELKETDRKGVRERSGRNPLRRAFRERRRRGPQIRLPDVAGRHRLKTSRGSLRFGTNATRGPRPSAAPDTRWSSAAGTAMAASSGR